MVFDASKPYRLEFGRGSGRYGLDTIVLDEEGRITQHRQKEVPTEDGIYCYWQTRSFSIPSDTVKQVAALIEDLRIIEMKRAYHADVVDGMQWIFWLVQGGQEKSVYFNNHFPKAIQDFAVALDAQLRNAGIAKIKWTRVPDDESRQHEKAIWNSKKDRPNKPVDGD